MWVPELQPDLTAAVVPVGILTTSRYCWAGCSFCRLAIPLPKVPLSRAPIGLTWDQVEAAAPDFAGVAMVKLRGGLSTSQSFDYWIHFIRRLRKHFSGRLMVFSPIELWQYHMVERRSLRDLLRLLKWAGADLVGPGGSETWSDDRRTRWAPYRIETREWLKVVEVAAAVGLDYAVAPMIVPQVEDENWDDYVAVLRTLEPDHIEVKPLQSEGTAWSVMGDASVLETAQVVHRLRQARPELTIYVRLVEENAGDAAEILGAAGADGVVAPQWEVAP